MNRKKHFISKSVAFLALFVLVGCRRSGSDPVPVGAPQAKRTLQRRIVGLSVERRPIECLVVGEGRDVTFVVAGIHGDEPAGTLLVEGLGKRLQGRASVLKGRKVVLLPVANPDGLLRKTRLNARGVDLNRNFPAPNREEGDSHEYTTLSEPETRAIDRIITQYSPNRIVSLHQLTDTGPEALVGRVPRGCIDYDGPGRVLAHRMAEYSDLPVEKLGAEPGSLGSYAGLTLAIPVITFELPLDAHVLDPEELWERYGWAMLAAVAYPDAIE